MTAVDRGSETNILVVGPVATPGGAEIALAELVRRLPDGGLNPQVVLLRHGPAEEWLAEAGAAVTVIESGSGRFKEAIRLPGVVRKMSRLIVEGKCRLVLSSLSKGHIYGGLAARVAGVPAVYWQHMIPGRRLHDLLAAKVPVGTVICSSDAAIAAQGHQTPRADLRKVHPGIDIERVRAHAGAGRGVRQDNGWEGKLVVGIVGRLEPWKGQRTFLRAAAKVTSRFPDTEFAVVGGAVLGFEGDYPEQLRGLAEQLQLSQSVTFTGYQNDVYPWIDALDIVVHASEEPEPFGLVVIEAMALGKAVIATAAGGPLETVEDRVSGLLVPPADPSALADAISRLLSDKGLRESIGHGARERSERFSSASMARGISEVLRDVLSRTL